MTEQEKIDKVLALGKKIGNLRKDMGVSTTSLERKGIHSSLFAIIEKGKLDKSGKKFKGITLPTLIDYCDAIGLELDVKVK